MPKAERRRFYSRRFADCLILTRGIIMQDIYYPSSDGKTTIHACIWQAEGEPKAVLQIIHGMAEYAARYAPLAEFLAKQGVTVCAEDHLGHGLSVRDKNYLGYFDDGRGTANPFFQRTIWATLPSITAGRRCLKTCARLRK